MYLLVNTDAKGRYHADPRIIKARCMTMRYDVRLELVAEALAELASEKLIHRYDVDGKPYLVLHDYDTHQPTGALRYVDSKFPEPPAGSIPCKCLEGRRSPDGAKHGAKAPSSLSLSRSHSEFTSSEEGDPKGEPKESTRFLAVKWNKGPGLHLNVDKAIQHVQAAVDVGVYPEVIDQRFSDYGAIKGLRIWEALDPLRPRGGVQVPTMDEIIKSASRKVGAK